MSSNTIEYMFTKLDVDCSSPFTFRAQRNIQTDKQMQLNDLPTSAAI